MVDETKILLEQLKNAIALTAKQDTIVWAVFGVFLAAEGVFFTEVLQSGAFKDRPVIGLAICMAASGIAFVWNVIQQRALKHLYRYENLVRALETKLVIPAEFATSPEINKEA